MDGIIVVVTLVVLVETVDRFVEDAMVPFVGVTIGDVDFGCKNATSTALTVEMTRKTAKDTTNPYIKARRHRRLSK